MYFCGSLNPYTPILSFICVMFHIFARLGVLVNRSATWFVLHPSTNGIYTRTTANLSYMQSVWLKRNHLSCKMNNKLCSPSSYFFACTYVPPFKRLSNFLKIIQLGLASTDYVSMTLVLDTPLLSSTCVRTCFLKPVDTWTTNRNIIPS